MKVEFSSNYLIIVVIIVLALFALKLFDSGTDTSYLDLGSCRIKKKSTIFGKIKSEVIINTSLSSYISKNNLKQPEEWVLTTEVIKGLDGPIFGTMYSNLQNGKLLTSVNSLDSFMELDYNWFLLGKKRIKDEFEIKKIVENFIELLKKKDYSELEKITKELWELERSAIR